MGVVLVMHDYKSIVDDYIREFRFLARAEISTYAQESGLSSAISRAALGKLPNGKKHPHQYRIPCASLKEAEIRLLRHQAEIRNCTTFKALHDFVNSKIRDICMIGELTVYDISTRIGAFRHISPEHVYLHRGTREGARALGYSGSEPMLEPGDLPREFLVLEPHEIEDCLCIYKEMLKQIGSGKRKGCLRGNPPKACRPAGPFDDDTNLATKKAENK